MKKKLISEMNNDELLLFLVQYLKDYTKELDSITTGNLAHRIANLKHGLLNMSDYVNRQIEKNKNKV